MDDSQAKKKPAAPKGAATKKTLTPEQRRRAEAAKKAKATATPSSAKGKRPVKGGAPAPAKKAVQQPKDVPMVYGAEALAALTVAESKNARLKSKFILFLLILCVALIGWNAILHASKPEPKMLGMTVDGRIQELPLLDEPLESRQILMDWTRRNIPDLYDWNYSNFRAELNKARDFVQQVTLEEFSTDLEESGILPKVRKEFLILRANITNEPVVVNETTVKGRRLYVLEIPMTLVYDSGDIEAGQRRQINQDILFTAWVVRASILEYDAGLMLAKYAVKQG